MPSGMCSFDFVSMTFRTIRSIARSTTGQPSISIVSDALTLLVRMIVRFSQVCSVPWKFLSSTFLTGAVHPMISRRFTQQPVSRSTSRCNGNDVHSTLNIPRKTRKSPSNTSFSSTNDHCCTSCSSPPRSFYFVLVIHNGSSTTTFALNNFFQVISCMISSLRPITFSFNF